MKRITLLCIALLALSACSLFRGQAKNPDPNHTHANFAVFINGQRLDLAKDKYMSGSSSSHAPGEEHNPYLHMHDGNGGVIHRHKPGLTLGDFFASIGFRMNNDCFITDDGTSYCAAEGKRWRMFVNGKERPYAGDYVFQDDDRILLTYGSSETQIQQQIKQVPDDACMYSQTCPERGKAPKETCISDPSVPCTE